jgi:hypothetical protein
MMTHFYDCLDNGDGTAKLVKATQISWAGAGRWQLRTVKSGPKDEIIAECEERNGALEPAPLSN